MVVMEEIYEVFDDAVKINIYKDGNVTVYSAGDDDYGKILCGWNSLLENSHPMPAFGVSLNDMTVEAMKNGLWIEFEFGKQLKCCQMSFEKLLVEVKKEYCGFNIIRYTSDNGYYGRCYYIDLENNNMGSFYDILLNL